MISFVILSINTVLFVTVFLSILLKCSCNRSDEMFKYRTYSEINAFLEIAETKHKDIVSSFIIGQSVEGRAIKGIKISKDREHNATKLRNALLIDAGIHAREWVSPVALMHIVHQLLENTSYSNLTDTLDWYILPMLNPDGYVYSMDLNGLTETFFSFKIFIRTDWRKNRSPSSIPQCKGVDLNRNFDYYWGGAGSSDDPCSLAYRGPYPFSEPESLAFAQFVLSIKTNVKMYLTLHSAAQAILYPWGYTELVPPDWKDLELLANEAVESIAKINGTRYQVGPTTQLVGAGAGGSDDWAKGVVQIKYVYTIELPGHQYPHEGFHPPLVDLPRISEEIFQGIRVFAKSIIP